MKIELSESDLSTIVEELYCIWDDYSENLQDEEAENIERIRYNLINQMNNLELESCENCCSNCCHKSGYGYSDGFTCEAFGHMMRGEQYDCERFTKED